jgi:hypothetical protein
MQWDCKTDMAFNPSSALALKDVDIDTDCASAATW